MRRLPALAAAMFPFAACSQDDGGTTTRAVDSGRSERPAGAAAPSDAATIGDDSAAVDDDASEDIAGDTGGDVADLRLAQPGTWPVGEVGTVTFDVVDRRPVLEDHQAAEGWDATAQEDDSDTLEFEAREGDREVDVEVELDDGQIEVEIDYSVTSPVQE